VQELKPILFSTEMVKAILEGRKTQTRRVIKPQTVTHNGPNGQTTESIDDYFMTRNLKDAELLCLACAPYRPGGILWVRETWRMCLDGIFCHKADGDCDTCSTTGENTFNVKWKPSIHMPREACRLFLKITDIKVERLQEITEEDALKEGCMPIILDDAIFFSAKGKFHALWDSIYAKRGYGWEVNPWVWVITFENVEKL
jgi:hypothetical protein